MNLISWTLAGPGTAPIIGDAIRSALPFVDHALVVWTGQREAAREWADVDHAVWAAIFSSVGPDESPERYRLHFWPWCNDYGAARNAALVAAEDHGASWSCMVDTDERVICPDPQAFRAWLDALPDHIVVALAHSADGSHTRERFFRHPCSTRFVGRTHEMFGPVTEDKQAIVPRELLAWTELPKSPEQLRAKFLRDVDMLREEIREHPENGAAHYYLGSTLQALGQHEEAIEHFRAHNRVSTWEEGRAWSCFKAAECYLVLGQPYRVLECAAQGLVHDAGIAELYWIASIACLQRGWTGQAKHWAECAKVHKQGSEAEIRRRGFRDVRGLTFGPDQVIEAARTVGASSA